MINKLSGVKISVIIPIGPNKEENKKIAGENVVKPFLLLGKTKNTLIGRVLKQLSAIEGNIETVHLIAQRSDESQLQLCENEAFVRNKIMSLAEVPTTIKDKINLKVGTGTVVEEISSLQLTSDYFMFHNPDIILPLEKAESLYQALIEEHTSLANDTYVATFVSSSLGLCRGERTLRNMGVFDQDGLIEKEMKTFPGDDDRLSVNVAISMFNSDFLGKLKERMGNIFYQEVAKIFHGVRMTEEIRWMEYCYYEPWYHADNLETIGNFRGFETD